MPRVSKVRCPKFDLYYGFLYDIRTPDELMDYFEEVAKPRWGRGWQDAAQCQHANHGATAEGNVLMALSSMGEKPIIEVLGKIQLDMFMGMERSLPIFVNNVGGYFNQYEGLEVSETQKVKGWVLPSPEGARIKISCFPNGKHYYARVGDQEVEIWGSRKWESEKSARYAAEKFAEERGIRLAKGE